MSEPMRFSLKHHGQLSCVEHCPEGEYVLHSDYARLKAEVERLTKERDKALTDFWYIHEGYFRLEAEVNRLTASKDGNSMCGVVAPYVVPPCIDKYTAKEGKPRA
jgi:hypothetical protein